MNGKRKKQTRAARLRAMVSLETLTKECQTARKPPESQEFEEFLIETEMNTSIEQHPEPKNEETEDLSPIIVYEPEDPSLSTSTIKRGRLKRIDSALNPNLYQKSPSIKRRGDTLKYKCTVCEKAFVTIAKLESHHQGHLPKEERDALKKFHCEYCPRTFKEQNKLNVHRNFKHLKNYNFICEICGKPFINSSELKRHATLSHAERQPCTICGKQVLNLELHYKDVHENSPKTCGICLEVLPNQKKLNKHRFKYHPFQIFECEICEKTYSERFCYKKHMSKKHGVVIQEDLIY